MRNAIILLLICALTGCATTGSSLRETVTSADGEVTVTEMNTRSLVTAWAEQQEGSGSADYEWRADGSGHITVGQAAIGQKANLPLEQVLSAILPVLMNVTTPSVPSSPAFRDQVMQFIRENPEIVSQALSPSPRGITAR